MEPGESVIATQGAFCTYFMLCWNKIMYKLYLLDRNTWNYKILYKLLLLDRNNWNYKILYKLLLFDRNTWNYKILYKLSILEIVIWSYNCWQIIISYFNKYLKSYNCIWIIFSKNYVVENRFIVITCLSHHNIPHTKDILSVGLSYSLSCINSTRCVKKNWD